jgi:hypothetical protein
VNVTLITLITLITILTILTLLTPTAYLIYLTGIQAFLSQTLYNKLTKLGNRTCQRFLTLKLTTLLRTSAAKRYNLYYENNGDEP